MVSRWIGLIIMRVSTVLQITAQSRNPPNGITHQNINTPAMLQAYELAPVTAYTCCVIHAETLALESQHTAQNAKHYCTCVTARVQPCLVSVQRSSLSVSDISQQHTRLHKATLPRRDCMSPSQRACTKRLHSG